MPSKNLLLCTRTLASIANSTTSSSIAIFWDLDNKPPNSIPPYDAAVRLKLAAASFGTLKFAVAYANAHAFRHVPAPIRAQRQDRRTLDRLENAGVYTPSEPYVCRVCGRNFYNHTKFINHFKQLHEREQGKRLRRLESAKGSKRVMLAAKLSMKMEKYRRAERDVLVPKIGYGLADELRRAGVLVRTVDDRPEAADRAIREHMVDTMDRRRVGCLMLVSDDAGFAGVLREARMRCLKTVVVGDEGDGVLKRCADAAFSWKEVSSGKARKEASSVVEKWRDRELLKRLEWRYRPEETEEVECGDLEEGLSDGDDEDGGDIGLHCQVETP
ncbi:uncharacterized protein LOC120267480 [Dioscorea cayenensis subsp. rotundata]|uniref:Uncharacterized protein LOC120267480 n=1 Tax=Dioscorea cayennensis subsp. rotundata TaxID=55577 RepID=A0AB40BY10_DIOCR|nr:uncharacterized protein LOC120267480 [Dioscorea cayenensis subsp. rotundata]